MEITFSANITVQDTLSRFDSEGPNGYNPLYMNGRTVMNTRIDKKGTVKGYYDDNKSKKRVEGKDRMRFKVTLEDGSETDWLEESCIVIPEVSVR
jgi:hypothetical protein